MIIDMLLTMAGFLSLFVVILYGSLKIHKIQEKKKAIKR